MIELEEKIWSNPNFHGAVQTLNTLWLSKQVGAPGGPLDPRLAAKMITAASALACSQNPKRRELAFRIATSTFELFGSESLPLDQALRVVLARLGNFPAFATNPLVASALAKLPWTFAAEELYATNRHTVQAGHTALQLTDFQLLLWSHLQARSNIALAAPTSAGKSFVLEAFVCALAAQTGPLQVTYLVPTRALIAQVSEDIAQALQRQSGDLDLEIVTAPLEEGTELPGRAIYVMTQERVQIMLSSHPTFANELIIVDEAQSIADGSRGILLQSVVDDLLRRNPRARVLFASPTVKNLGMFGRLFGLDDVTLSDSAEPTVAQNIFFVDVTASRNGKIVIRSATEETESSFRSDLTVGATLASRVDTLVHIPNAIANGQANLIYANGQADAETIAIQLSDLATETPFTPGRDALSTLASETVHPKFVLATCVRKGIGFHYSNIPTILRRALEKSFARGELNTLVCTSTLLQGVNLPAKNIFMNRPEKGSHKAIGSTDFWNLAGRAGRLQREFQGNIFLIDYSKWASKPLDGPKRSDVAPAISSAVKTQFGPLIETIEGHESKQRRSDHSLNSAFVRLLADRRVGRLHETLARADIIGDGLDTDSLASKLDEAAAKISLPSEILKQTSSISPHRQQALFDLLSSSMADRQELVARSLIPAHPRESGAYDSFARILYICHTVLLHLDASRGLHRFQALMALKWMQGISLPQIIQEQIQRNPTKSLRIIIRNTLDVIESQIRFEVVRLFGCYNALLSHAFSENGLNELVKSIPGIPLFLEVGASDQTMISFINLGLSRVVATKLNEISARKDLDVASAREWLRTRDLESLGLSPLLEEEVQAVIAAAVPSP